MRILNIRNIKMQSINVSQNKDNNKKSNVLINVLRVVIFTASISLIIAGIINGGFRDVMAKAIRICYECIGIG